MENENDFLISSVPRTHCAICKSQGFPLYKDLNDRIFNAPGKWNFKKCTNPSCGILWLDPMPLEKDLHLAYKKYYTHHNVVLSTPSRETLLKNAYNEIKICYLALKYGYKTNTSFFKKIIGTFLYLHPGYRAAVDLSVFYLQASQGGKLLDIGCGDGHALTFMQQLGWDVQGVDIDSAAVQKAQEKGLNVLLGAVDAQNYPDNYFNAITMSHVIEHVIDPFMLLRECYRILKTGGQLVIVTPNVDSWGHKKFKHNWRGLEPPRHLQIFTSEALRGLSERVGFLNVRAFTEIGHTNSMFIASKVLEKSINFDNVKLAQQLYIKIWARSMQLIAWIMLKFKPCIGEDILIIAKK